MEHLQRKCHIMSCNWPHQTFELDGCPGCPLGLCPPCIRAAGPRLRSYLEALAVACSGSEREDI